MTSTTPTREPDQDRLDQFLAQAIGDLGATVSAAMVVLGDRLGLYRAMADGTPMTAEVLADRTGTSPVYLRPWLANQAAGGYVAYDASSQLFSMTPEQACVLADEDGPAFFPGSMQLALATLRDVPAIEACFRSGDASAGTSTTRACSRGRSASSDPATSPTSYPPGCPRWTVWSPGCRPGPWRRTSAAATAHRRSSWRRPTPPRPSSAPTTTRARSESLGVMLSRLGSPTGCVSRPPTPPRCQQVGTTS